VKITDGSYLQPEELHRLLRAAQNNPRDYFMLTLQYDLGCRSGELRQLRSKDLDLEHGVAYIGHNQEEYEQRGERWTKALAKSGPRRSVLGLMVPNIAVLVQSHVELFQLRPDELLFFDMVHGGQRTQPLSIIWHNRIVDKYARKAGIQSQLPSGRKRVTNQILRRTHIMYATRGYYPPVGQAAPSRREEVASLGDIDILMPAAEAPD